MDGFNPYKEEERKPSLGELEARAGEWLLMGFRFFKVAMPKGKEDEDAVRRVGALIRRRFSKKWTPDV